VCDIGRDLGTNDVLCVDPDPEHRTVAAGSGAHTAAAIEPIAHGFDLADEVTGPVDRLALARQMTRSP
jgi:hypothetical protein